MMMINRKKLLNKIFNQETGNYRGDSLLVESDQPTKKAIKSCKALIGLPQSDFKKLKSCFLRAFIIKGFQI
jgi:hypothetical protein